MSRKPRNIILLLSVLACLVSRGFAATALGSITIGGGEQVSGNTYDTGTVTATINGVSVSFAYGQFTTPAGVASALGALISNNCNMPVYAQANGTSLTFYKKGSNTVTSASITSVSNNPSLFPTISFLVNGSASWGPPIIESMSSTEGPVGMGFVIYGTNFGSAPSIVWIGNIAATIVSWSPTQITVQVPNGLKQQLRITIQ